MERAKTIDELYAEVGGYDLVITNDAALATALNARVDRPIVGPFALTPKYIAAMTGPDVMKKPVLRDLKLISAIAQETDLDFKYVHSEIENIKEIRRYTSSVEKHLYSDPARKVWESFSKMPSLTTVMDAFDPEKHEFFGSFKRIAVIGLELFDDLDKHFIPRDFDEIDMFAPGDYRIGEIREIGNDRQVAENAVDLIDPSHADDYAVVLNAKSPLTDAVRSALYRRGLPFINSLNVKDLTQVRDYLQFLNLSLSYPTLRVKHVRELFLNYNGRLESARDEYLLSKQLEYNPRPRPRELMELMRDIKDRTFSEVIGVLGHAGDVQVRMLINDMGLTDELVTPKRVSELVYAVNNVGDLHHNEEIPEYERTGVLIADCANSMYVDRPVVLYLGMEQDWNLHVAGKRYLDAEQETENGVTRLKVLLQQGSKRVYCVNTTKSGRKARPSLSFDYMLGRPAETFADICGNLITGRWSEPQRMETIERGESVLGYDKEFPFSKSTFNSYFTCPRAFMFESLIGTPDEKNTKFGSFIHAFAELYACYPETVREKGLDVFVEMVSDRFSGLSSPAMEDLDNDRIRMAMTNIMRFIDYIGIDGVETDRPVDDKHGNFLMKELGITRCSSSCETDENPKSMPMHGHFDLYRDGIVYDYKTGKSKDAEDIAKRMDPEGKNDYPDFQPLFYLAMASVHDDSKGIFKLFFPMHRDVESARRHLPVSEGIRTVLLYRGDWAGCLEDGMLIDSWIEAELKTKLRDKPDGVKEAIRLVMLGQDEDALTVLNGAAGISNCKTNRKTMSSTVNKLKELISARSICADDCLEIPQSTLDEFMETVVRMHAEAMEQCHSDLPARPLNGCKNCRFFYACTRDPADAGGERRCL